LKEPYALEAGHHYSPTEAIDRMSRCWFGEEHDLKWFQKNGVIRYPRDVEESYIGPFLKARLPIYLEHFLQRGEELKDIIGQMRLEWDFSDYTPFSEWLPCPSYDAVRKGAYEFFAVHYKLPYTYGGFGNENPWIDELCEHNGYAYGVLINENVAKQKGFSDGEEVWLESPVCKVRVKLKFSQCVHPQVLGIAGHFGHWAPGMPIAKGKGMNFNSLLPTDLEHIDKISTALDHCVEVKLCK
jgi:anaerobic selenocysteine-containing dehydrogenase